MSTAKTKGFSIPFVLYLVVLLGLVYMFHTELFVTGMRMYVSVANNPHAERLLGDYYQNSAHQNNELASIFYVTSMKKYKEQLNTATPERQASIKLMIGQFYLCAKGTNSNPLEAKRWFEEALKLENDSNSKSPELLNEIKQSLAMTEGTKQGSVIGGDTQPCHFQSEAEFFSHAINP